ncbi:MAG: lipopolysaccharide heptosyltransferase [Candidatus Hydrogenedentota bacterium]
MVTCPAQPVSSGLFAPRRGLRYTSSMRPLPEPRHILVHLPNWLGDVVMATPALRALRRRFPAARITWVGRAGCCALLEGLPHADAILPLPARPGVRDMYRLARALPSRPDLGIALPHSARAALLLWAAGCRARLGYDRGGRRHLLTHTVPPYTENGSVAPIYMAQEYLNLLAPLGVAGDEGGLELWADPSLVRELRSRLSPSRPVVGLAPGAAFGPSKQWLPERFAEVASRLTRELGAQCLLFTGPGEEETREAVLRAASVPLVDPQEGAPSVARLRAGVAACDLLIGNDSAPRHIAIAFGVPVLCIMGPTSPRYTESPWERGEVIRIDVDCGPCQKPRCATDHRCMTGISAERVFQSASRWLAPAAAE